MTTRRVPFEMCERTVSRSSPIRLSARQRVGRLGPIPSTIRVCIKHGRIGGRKAFSKQFKEELIARYGARDAFTGELLDARYLQIDHRIPYQVIGDAEAADRVEEFMLIDGSSQRAKSWSCEHCKNWLEIADPEICRGCFWAFPENYNHLAMEPVRRIDLMWRGAATAEYEGLKREAGKHTMSVQDYIKALIRKALSG